MPTEGANQNQANEGGGTAEIRWGVYQDVDEYVGMSVGQIREQLDGVWNIPTDTQTFVGDKAVGNDYVIQANDSVNFIRRSGEKG